MRRCICRGFFLLSLLALISAAPVVINDDAGWCWFEDARAVFTSDRLVAGSVANGSADPSRRGSIEVSSLDLKSGAVERFALHPGLEADDHASPALLVLPDGRILAVYSRHGKDRLIRYQVSKEPGSISAWSGERTFAIRSLFDMVSYSNLFWLEQENGRIYDFFRGQGFDPNVLVSDDNGESWRYAGRLLAGPGRPYVRYASNQRDTIAFIATEQHPRDFNNSLYHGYVRAGKIYDSFGQEAGRLGAKPARFERLTRIFAGDADNVAWAADLALDNAGNPYAVYSVQKDGAGKPQGRGGQDLRYRYARFDGAAWHDSEVGFAGSRLYAGEDDYSGLICLDPRKLDTVYFSANVDPQSGRPLISAADSRQHYEIFKGVTPDGGLSWSFIAITRDSSVDNIRPKVPEGGPPGSALIWLAGRFQSYINYDLEMVALIPAP